MANLKHEFTTEPIKGESFGDKLTRGYATVSDTAGNVQLGIAKGVEGIADFFATASGFFGDDEYKEKVKKWVEQDNAEAIRNFVAWNPIDQYLYPYLADRAEAAGKTGIANLLRANTISQSADQSYLKDNAAGDFVKGIAQSAGGMMFDYAVGGVIGKIASAAGALPSVAQSIHRGTSLATLGVRASGTGAEEAYQEGASFYRGAAYGLAQGATEVATEMMFDSPVNRIYGKGLLSPVKNSAAKTGVRLLRDASGEALEEVAAELLSPIEKAIYKGKESFKDYGTGDYWKQVGLAGASGAVMPLITGGATGAYTKRGSADYYTGEARADMTKRENLSARGKLTAEEEAAYKQNISANIKNASSYLARMSDDARAKYFEKNKGLAKIFDEKGKVRPEFAARAWGEGTTGAAPKYASMSARYDTDTINRDIQAVNAKEGTNIALYDGGLDEKQQSGFERAEKAVAFLNTEADTDLGVVVVSSGENAFHVGGNNIYISENHLADKNLMKTLVEEAVHSLQTTDESGQYSNDYYRLLHAIALSSKMAPAIDAGIRSRYKNLANVDTEALSEKIAKKEKLSADEQEYFDELGAQITAEILGGNEEFINQFAKSPKFAERFLNAFEKVKNAFARMTDKQAKAVHRQMADTERLLLNALAENGYSYKGGKVTRVKKEAEKEQESVEKDGEVRYNRRGLKFSFQYQNFPGEKSSWSEAHRLAVWWARRDTTQVKDQTLISFHDRWYLVERFDDATNGYQVMDRVTDAEYKEIAKEIKEHGRSGQIKSIQESADRIDLFDQQRNTIRREKSSPDGYDTRHGGENQQLQRVGEKELERRETGSNRGRDSEGGGTREQGDTIRYSRSAKDTSFYQTKNGRKIASSMSMDTCKQMIDRLYRIVNPNQYEETPIYKNAEEWLNDVGASEVALYAENEYVIQEKYLNNIQSVTDGDVYVEDIIEAYQNNALVGGNNKKSAVRLDVSQNISGIDNRFYSPKTIENAKRLYDVANQKMTTANKNEVINARAAILIFAHNAGAVETLGISQSELNKKLLSWSHYTQQAKDISQRINKGVAYSNQWTGIENSSWLYRSTVSEEDFAALVGDISGDSTEYERRFIASTMLALDTHIDYTGINFVFGQRFEKGTVYGTYSDPERTIRIKGGAGQNTVSHEIGHAIDHQWYRDVWKYSGYDHSRTSNNGLSEAPINFELIQDEEIKQWAKNYSVFVDNISDSSVIWSEYAQSKSEVFARFVAHFVEKTMKIAAGQNQQVGFSGYGDKFTNEQYIEFVKILQEKAKLDMRFRNDESGIRYSRGQNAKFAANQTGERVFSRKETQEAIDKMVLAIVLGDEYQQFQGELKGKGKKAAVDYLWEKLNRTPPDYRRAVAEKAAQQIIDSTVMTETWSDLTMFPEKDQEYVARAKSIVSMMADYMHRINFENIKGDVRFVKDDKFKDYARMWASKDAAKAISPDQLSDAFADIGIDLGADNPADIFLKAVDEYEKAKETIQNAVEKVALSEYGSKEELDAVKQKLVDEILDVFETGGQESKFSKLVSQYRNSIQFMKDMRSITDKVKEIKLQGKRFASDQRPENLKRALSTLTGIVRGNMLSPKVARQACLDLYEWYSPDNAMFKESPMYHETMRDMMETVGKGSGALTAEDMTDLEHIVDFMATLDKNFKRVYRNGEWKDADNDAKRFVDTAGKANKGLPHNPVVRTLQKAGRNYALAVLDPATVARMADRYRSGFFTQLYEDMRAAAFLQDKTRNDLNKARSDFYGEHKGYKPEKRTVNVRGVEMTASHAISLYMTTKRKQAWRGLVKSGYRLFMDGAEKAGPALGDSNVNYTDEQIEQMVAEFRRDVESQLTDTDKEYVSTMENILKEAGRLKAERDMQRYGFTNATEDYYYPILRSHVVKDLDANLETGKYFDIVSNLSMNKDTKQNAMGELGIQTVDAVVTRHIKQTAMYYALSNVVDNFNTLSNLNLSDNAGKPLTVRGTVEEGAFGKAALSYFQEMIKDLEGVSSNADASERAINHLIGKVRSNVAVAYIAANPKVIANQFSSLFAGQAILSPRDLFAGMKLIRLGNASQLDQYSEVARLRNAEYGAARGETLTDNINKIGEVAMKGVSATDRLVVQIEFAACQAYVARTQHLEIGSEENLKAAGKLMDRVILETQQSSTLTERSAFARSENEILKGLAMFRMDAMKQIGRVIDGFGELSAIKEDLASAQDEATKTELQGRQKTVRRKTAKAVGALVGTALYQALIGLLFAAFLNRLKDKEPEEIVKDTVVDGFAGLVTGLPVISHAVEFFADGYEVENFTISAFNDLLNSTKSLANLMSGTATEKDVKNALRTSIYAGGNLLGIPVRNTYNYFYGTVNTINDYAGYKVHSLLYSDNYKTDLYRAIEEGDTERVQTLSKLLAEQSMGGYSKSTKEAIVPLIQAGYTVLPKEIGDSVTFGGNTYTLTAMQRSRFKAVYGKAEAAVQKVVSLQSYKKLDPAVKAQTIKSIYDMYYGLAVDDMLGTDTENKNVLFSYAIDPDKLALIVAQAKSIEADKDKDGKIISGSKKQKVVAYINGLNLTAVQKYMIMGYLGYRNTKGEEQVTAYVNRLKLSKAEKKALLEYSGYGEDDNVA